MGAFINVFVDSSKHQAANSDSESDDSEPELKIGIPGSKAIFGEKTHPLRRTLWIVLATASFISAILQVQDRVARYISFPTRKEVRFERNDTLIFPWITICTTEPFNFTAMDNLRPLAAEQLGIEEDKIEVPYDLVSIMPLDQLWSTIKNHLNVTLIDCWFRRGKRCHDTGSWHEVMTIMGPCYQFAAKEPLRETGLFNGLYMQMDGFKLFRSNHSQNEVSHIVDGWKFIIHAEKYQSVLDIGQKGAIMMPDSSMDVRIILKQTIALDLKRRPCNGISNYSVNDCLLACLRRHFLANIGCLLPFMIAGAEASENVNRRHLCDSPDGYKKADEFLKKVDIWMDEVKCNCTKPCHAKGYLVNREKVLADVKPRRLRFRVFFQDTSFEQEIEEREYSLIGLFCDIGNTIGLLLGASVLTLAETLEWGGLSLTQRLNRSSPSIQQAGHRQLRRRVHPGNSLSTEKGKYPVKSKEIQQ